MIHLSRASMLSNACARRHMHKFGSFSATGKVTENRGAKTTLLIITPAYLRFRSSCLALEIAQPKLSSGRDSAFIGSALLRNACECTLHVHGGWYTYLLLPPILGVICSLCAPELGRQPPRCSIERVGKRRAGHTGAPLTQQPGARLPEGPREADGGCRRGVARCGRHGPPGG